MSILTMIDQIPLFSNPSEAMTWGGQYGLTSYHTHIFQGQTGYMAGTDHNQTVTSVFPDPIPQAVQTAYPSTTTTSTPTTPTSTTTTTTTTTSPMSTPASSGSGGGGGGY